MAGETLQENYGEGTRAVDMLPCASQVAVFAAPPLEGSRASVRLLSRAPSEQDLLLLTGDDDAEASCLSWRQGTETHAACYNNGVAIDFCGHGLLACAAAWRARHMLPRTIQTAKGSYAFTEDSAGNLWLHAPRCSCSQAPAAPPDWFNYPAESAAVAGDGSGYWILRWPEGFDLNRLKPDFSAICQATRRAIIATRRARPGSDHDVGLRYFAPQYGQAEDSVTGSAAVVLADYWHLPNLVFRQYSSRGGIMRARLDATEVAISGSVQVEPAPASDATGNAQEH